MGRLASVHRVLKVSFLPLTKVLGVAHVDVVALTGGPLIHTVVVLKVSLELIPKFLVYGEFAKSDQFAAGAPRVSGVLLPILH